MRTENINEIDNLISKLNELKASSIIDIQYTREIKQKIIKLNEKINRVLTTYKLNGEEILLNKKWSSIEKDFYKLPKTLKYIVVDKPLDEMSEIEYSNYLMKRNHLFDVARREKLLQKYKNYDIATLSLTGSGVVFTICKHEILV